MIEFTWFLLLRANNCAIKKIQLCVFYIVYKSRRIHLICASVPSDIVLDMVQTLEV